MAYIGLRKPIVYPMDSVNAGNYLDGVAFGKAVSFSMTPNVAEAQLYGDDILAESEKAVTSATLSLGTTDIPEKCKSTMFGHKEGSEGTTHKLYGDDILAESEKAVTSATLSLGTTDIPEKCKSTMFGHKEGSEGTTHKEYTYNVDDDSAYVGFAVIGVKKVDGKRIFEVQAFPKTQWKDPTTEIQTRGESTQFTTPSCEGTALPLDDGNYKFEQCFDTEQEALDYLKKKFPKHGGA